MKEKRLAGAALYHIIIFAIGIIMVYPLIWMVMSSFKETNTIFTTASSLIPEHFVTDNYANGWQGFAIQGFFVYLLSNFIGGIPIELDEAAKIDGCSYWGIFTRIMIPLIKPAVVTGCIFSFMWRWDDFLSALLYINKTAMYPVSLALKLFCDPGSSSDYGAMFAMASLSILPSVLIFIFFQKYLVEGISTSGLKG